MSKTTKLYFPSQVASPALPFFPFGELWEEPQKIGARMKSTRTESTLGTSGSFYRNSEQQLDKGQPSYLDFTFVTLVSRMSYDVGIGGKVSNAPAF